MVHTGNALAHAVRSVFISDVHLGTRSCRAEPLLTFLEGLDTEHLFLVGDIVDLWSLQRSVHWPDSHTAVLQSILTLSRRGTRVIYVPGNHDHTFRQLAGHVFGRLETHRDFVHETAEGRRMLVLHGDEFDGVVHCHPALARLGCWLYDGLLALNPAINAVRGAAGLPWFSLATALKQATPRARRYMRNFEEAAAQAARRRGLDGVICGHIHQPACHEIDGTLYCNDGDWVENCTALIEDRAGRLGLHRPAESPGLRETRPLRIARAA